MKLQARFLILFMLVFGVFALVMFLQHKFDGDRSTVLLKNELAQRRTYFEKITDMDGQPLKTLSVDYSFWDDMVDFVKTRNPTFAADNIDSGIANYGADASWVYRLDNSLVYYKSVNDDASLRQLNLPPAFFNKLYSDHFEHFFLNEPSGLIEVRAATIHPGSDSGRKTPPQGYWLVARVWDSAYTASLGQLTQSRAGLSGATADAGDRIGSNTVTFADKLSDWNGQTVAVLTSSSDVPVVDDLRKLYLRQVSLLAAFAMLTVLALIGAIWSLVLSPVRIITLSLTRRNPAILDRLAHQGTELGSLAQTIQQFFAQDQKIRENSFIKSKLMELNQAKSEFLAIAAHELKGSVGNVHVFAENLAELISGRTPKKVLLDEVQRISHQAHKATVLINDIYQASKGGQSLVLNRTEFDFDEFIRGELDDAQYSTRQRIVLCGFTAAHITSDRDRLSQVMSNLLRNAAKYSPQAEEVRVILRREGNNVVVQVQDDGIGIAADEQPRVFERFFRSSRVTKTYPGLGLGLSIKEIVEALGGKIWFTSEAGNGSAFFVSLPVSAQSTELL
jgi:signal transduction histidine kinase